MELARAYLAGFWAQAWLDTAHANVELSASSTALGAIAKERRHRHRNEITRAQVQLANDRRLGLVAENDVDRSRLQLLKIIGLRLDNPVQLTGRLEYIPTEAVDAAQALATAHDHRAELKAQQKPRTTPGSATALPKWSACRASALSQTTAIWAPALPTHFRLDPSASS